MTAPLHMIKLSVGTDSVDDLADWQTRRVAERRAAGLDPRPRHVTRMWPRRADEIVGKGSIYWVIRGAVLARQSIEDLVEVRGEDGIRRCAIVFLPEIVLVVPRPRRPFQGWRYLASDDAPPDLAGPWSAGTDLPPDLAVALDSLGVVARRG